MAEESLFVCEHGGRGTFNQIQEIEDNSRKHLTDAHSVAAVPAAVGKGWRGPMATTAGMASGAAIGEEATSWGPLCGAAASEDLVSGKSGAKLGLGASRPGCSMGCTARGDFFKAARG